MHFAGPRTSRTAFADPARAYPLRGTEFVDASIHYIEKAPQFLIVIREYGYRDAWALPAAEQVYAVNIIQSFAKFLSAGWIIEWLSHILKSDFDLTVIGVKRNGIRL